RSIALQTDGSIVTANVLGDNPTTLDHRFVVTRLAVNGSVDTTFGTAGQASAAFPGVVPAVPSNILLQSDGKFIVAGGAGLTQFHLVLARYNQDGSLDQSFGNGGRVTTSFIPGGSTVFGGVSSSAVLQTDGKILALVRDQGKSEFVRFNANG